jgi:hypothetical protein
MEFPPGKSGQQGARSSRIGPAYQPCALQQGGIGMAMPPAAPPSGPQSDPDPDHFPVPGDQPEQPDSQPLDPAPEPPEKGSD